MCRQRSSSSSCHFAKLVCFLTSRKIHIHSQGPCRAFLLCSTLLRIVGVLFLETLTASRGKPYDLFSSGWEKGKV